ncbi:Pyruvate carboxylase [Colletotrichum sp. SAR 10_86]|nr:Pyruvate carboxylase [Colletotrichum sp. SAR 10_65]KAI8220002.1 Pyruvate carboxylase [Colletotrichum sp. SAR 10_86]KAJ5004294.1 Pyruvate carboxylase [Colletotrichum sp. SAR 10_66]
MAQTQPTFNDVFEDGDVEEVQKDPQTIHHIRANSSIMHLKKILVANRGEIPIRIFRTAHELSLHTIAVFSYEDRLSMHRQKADEAYVIGKRGQYTPVGAYLAGDEIIKIAVEHGAQMIHPGYGFLSENAEFARNVEKAGLIFVGPTADVIDSLGDKVSARKLAIAADVPVVPGTEGAVATFEEVKSFTDQYGFPIIIKAAYGGGGRGMRVVREQESLKESFERATSEAKSAFGNGTVFVERFLDKPKHIEVQLLGDNHGNIVHLYERDCSVQRRHQKVVEIAPAKDLPTETRDAILNDAVKLAKSVNYRNAGTAEFLVDQQNRYYFIEINPRIQVEHTITEEITGIDIVAAQIQIAAGATLQQLGLTQDRISTRGFAIQCRITTEDPAKGFSPDTGKIEVYRSAGGNGVRLDGGNGFAGAVITPYYDSMLVKCTCHGSTYEIARRKILRALVEFRIRGVKTNIPFLASLLTHPTFIDGNCWTTFIDDTPQLFDLIGSQNRAQKLLAYLGDVAVNGSSIKGQIGEPKFKGDIILPELLKEDGTKLDVSQPCKKGWRQIIVDQGPKAFAKAVRANKGCLLMDTTWRDAHQSLLATRVRTVDLLNISKETSHALSNLYALECWGGATFDVAYRFLYEDPWDRLRRMRKAVPNIPFQMLLRGANGVAYASLPDNAIDHFVEQAKKNGVDIFRVFDALNDIDQLEVGIKAVHKAGGVVEGTVCISGDLLAGTLEEFILWVCWIMLSLSPKWAVNLVFFKIFAAKEEMAACLQQSAMHFAPGLWDVIRSETPPAVAFFKSLPTEYIKRWAIYVLVLEKSGSIPKIYIGAGTEKRSGVATRMGQYRRGENYAANVQKALSDGYRIVHMGLLCWMPLPPASARIRSRCLILILEAAFTLWFWAMASNTANYGMPVSLRPWDPETLEYKGCYGHFSLREGAIELKDDLSSAEINTIEAERRLKNSRRDAKVRGPVRTARDAKNKRQRNLAAKKWFCHACNVNFGARNQLRHHQTLQKHTDNVAGITKVVKNPRTKARNQENFDSKRYYCSICDYTAKTQQKLTCHLETNKHERKNPKKKYNLEYYLSLVDKLVALDIHVLGLKDMAGVLKPHAGTLLVGAIRKKYPDLPIHVHTHDSAGTGVASMVACAQAGADAVDAATDSLSGMTSQPSINAIIASLEGSDLDPGLNPGHVRALDTYWQQLRLLYSPFEAHLAGPDPEVYEHEIPGGQLTNMMFQASQLGLGTQWAETKKAYEHANDLLGDIVKVTPTSKVVGDLAQFMVSNKLTAEDVKARASELDFPGSVLEFLEGMMGQPYGGFPEPLRSDALRGRRKLDKRPGLFLEPVDLAKVKRDLHKKFGGPVTECDIAAYVMYPKVFEDYKKFIQKYGDLSVLPTKYFLSRPEIGEEFHVELEKGKVLILKLLAIGPLSENTGQREVFYEMNGEVRQVTVDDNKASVENVSRPKADPSDSSQVGAPMAGVLVELRVKDGSDVKKGDPIAVLSAMKMEMVISAPHNGKVSTLQVKEGDSVDGSDLVCRIVKA